MLRADHILAGIPPTLVGLMVLVGILRTSVFWWEGDLLPFYWRCGYKSVSKHRPNIVDWNALFNHVTCKGMMKKIQMFGFSATNVCGHLAGNGGSAY